MIDAGYVAKVTTFREAIADIIDFEQRLGVEPNPQLIAVLRNNP